MSSAAPGGAVIVGGDGFGPGSTGQVLFASTPVQVSTFTADNVGHVSVRVTVPISAKAGSHHIILRGTDAAGKAREVSIPLTVTTKVELPLTGADLRMPAAVGIDLVLLGLAVVLLGNARRREWLRRS